MSKDPGDLADAYLHGLLTADESKSFERRLQSEPVLQSALAAARHRLALIEAALPPAEASESLVRQTLEGIQKADVVTKRRRRIVQAIFWIPVAAAVVFLGLFHIRSANLAATPIRLEVFGHSEWQIGAPATVHIRLADRDTGRFHAGVPVEILMRPQGAMEYTSVAATKTDGNGHAAPTVDLPDWAEGSYELVVHADAPGGSESVSRFVRLKRSVRLIATTDKPRYQPGQTIHLLALALKQADSLPAAGQPVSFSVSDPFHRQVFQTTKELNRFGLGAADYTLDAGAPVGPYRIWFRVGDTTTTLTMPVERYTLPRMKLRLTTDKRWYRPDEPVQLTLEAQHDYGEPVNGATWNVEVDQPPLPGPGMPGMPGMPGVPFLLKSGVLDRLGKAKIELTGLPRQLFTSDSPTSWTLSAWIGEDRATPEKTSVEVVFSEQPLALSLEADAVSEADGMMPLRLLVQTPDHQRVAARGTLQVIDRAYPFETNETGIAEIRVPSPPDAVRSPGLPVRITLVAPHAFERTLPLPISSVLPRNIPLQLRTDRDKYRAGDTVRVTVQAPDGPIYFDFQRDGQTRRTASADVKNGQGEYEFEVSPEMHGNWAVFAYRFADGARPYAATRFRVDSADTLKITTRFDRPTYAPGATAHIDIRLTDDAGRPVAGALSLSMIQEAVNFNWQALHSPPTDSQDTSWYRNGAFTMQADSFSGKQIAALKVREERLQWISRGWFGLGTIIVIAAYVFMWARVRTLYVLIIHGIAGFAIVCGGGALLLISLASTERPNTFGSAERAASVSDMAKAGKMEAPSAPAPPSGGGPGAPNIAPADGFVPAAEPIVETLLWRPIVLTDADGRASLDVEMPPAMTSWRFAGQAVTTDGRLGFAEATVVVKAPYLLRLEAPQALTLGDHSMVRAAVTSYSDQAQTIEVALPAAPSLKIEAKTHRLELPPRGVVAVRFPIEAVQVGDAQLHVQSSAAGYEQVSLSKLSVRAFTTPESAATATHAVQTTYDVLQVKLGGRISVRHRIDRRIPTTVREVTLVAPIPAGFQIDTTDLDRLAQQRQITRYRVDAGTLVVTLSAPQRSSVIAYSLEARLPGSVTAPAASVAAADSPGEPSYGTAARLEITAGSK